MSYSSAISHFCQRCKGSRVGNLGLTIKAKFLKPNNISFASCAWA